MLAAEVEQEDRPEQQQHGGMNADRAQDADRGKGEARTPEPQHGFVD